MMMREMTVTLILMALSSMREEIVLIDATLSLFPAKLTCISLYLERIFNTLYYMSLFNKMKKKYIIHVTSVVFTLCMRRYVVKWSGMTFIDNPCACVFLKDNSTLRWRHERLLQCLKFQMWYFLSSDNHHLAWLAWYCFPKRILWRRAPHWNTLLKFHKDKNTAAEAQL